MNATSLWHGCAALLGFSLVLAGCQPDDPYQDAAQPPSSREQQAATAQAQSGDDAVPGATSQLPLAERAEGAEQAWSDATQADYQAAVDDCRTLSGVARDACIEEVRVGFRAARVDARNPEELQQIRTDAGLDSDTSEATADTTLDEEGDSGDR